MGAPAQVSQLEFMLMQHVLEHVAPTRMSGAVVLEFRRHPSPREGSLADPGPFDSAPPSARPEPDHDVAGGPLMALKAVAQERARAEARLIQVAKDVVAATGAVLLADKGFTSVEELSATATKKWRAEAKATAVGEIQIMLGMGIMNARRLVGLACATERTQATVVDALDRGEASLDMVLRFWERCGRLPDDDGADVAEAMFGTDPSTAAHERLDPKGELKARPWHEGEYAAALEREALCREGKDVEAKREQRRRARDERDATLRVGDDGMATLTLRCPLTTGAAIYQRIDRCSRSLRSAGDPRTLRQLRSDIISALLLHGILPLSGWDQAGDQAGDRPSDQPSDWPEGPGGHSRPGEHRADTDPATDDLVSPADLDEIARILNAAPAVQLQVVIPWDALTGRPAGAAFCPSPCCATETDKDPPPDPAHAPPAAGPDHHHRRGRGAVGEILGLHQSFITPELARVLAMQPGTTLARLLIDPADGRLIERSVKTYRPDADMRRQVRAADVMSRMPGSRRPAAWCDLDHEHAWAEGGPTSEANLNLKDRRPHSFKTKGWWRTAMAPNRDVTWTTLLGQSETTRCHDYRQYLDRRAPVDPDQEGSHPSQRTDRDDRLDLACQALYAALVHRDPHSHLADRDDSHGATDHDPGMGGWIWVSHTNPDGVRRHGPPRDHPTAEDVLGIPHQDLEPRTTNGSTDRAGSTGSDGTTDSPGTSGTPDSPWLQRAADDTPPF